MRDAGQVTLELIEPPLSAGCTRWDGNSYGVLFTDENGVSYSRKSKIRHLWGSVYTERRKLCPLRHSGLDPRIQGFSGFPLKPALDTDRGRE